jgi:hypothetical protein
MRRLLRKLRLQVFMLIGLFGWLLFASDLQAQSLMTVQAEVEVPISRENVAAARQAALEQGKLQLTLRGLAGMLTPEGQERLSPVLANAAEEAGGSLIESFRVTSERRADDLSSFSLSLEGRLFRSRIIAILQELGLPLASESREVRSLPLAIQAPPSLWNVAQLQELSGALGASLSPYQVRIAQVLSVQDLSAAPKDALVLEFQGLPKAWKGDRPAKVQARLSLLREKTLAREVRVEMSLNPSEPQWAAQIAEAFQPRWGPIIREVFTSELEGSVTEVQLLGVPGPLEEELVLRSAFGGNPQWQGLTLALMKEQGSLYLGDFRGNPEAQLQVVRENLQSWGLKRADWSNRRLTLEFDWNTMVAELQPFEPDLTLQRLLQELQWPEERLPEWQVPAAGSGAFLLPERGAVAGLIQNRGDSDLLKIRTGTGGMLNWSLLGATNLMPQVTVYDRSLKVRQRLVPNKKNQLSIRYSPEEVGEEFFIRISDEIGYIEGVVGGYQLFYYLIELEPQE